jgi:hypothetical protein
LWVFDPGGKESVGVAVAIHFFLVLFRSSGKLASFTQNRIQLIRALVNPFVDPFVGKF